MSLMIPTLLLSLSICVSVDHPLGSENIEMQESRDGFKIEKLVQCNEFVFPVFLALNLPPEPSGMQLRNIFLLIEAENFTKETLIEVFGKFAAEYKEPHFLSITAFSDRSMLQRAITTSMWQSSIDFRKTPAGRKAKEEFDESNYPLKSGYFRAYYCRDPRGDEYFSYSPDPMKEHLVMVDLKTKSK